MFVVYVGINYHNIILLKLTNPFIDIILLNNLNRMPFEACCPGVKYPGDDCPPVWGSCGHAFHMQWYYNYHYYYIYIKFIIIF